MDARKGALVGELTLAHMQVHDVEPDFPGSLCSMDESSIKDLLRKLNVGALTWTPNFGPGAKSA